MTEHQTMSGVMPDGMVLGGDNQIDVVTPDGNGNGGSITCKGDCTLTRPKDMAQTPEVKNGSIFEPMIKMGQTSAQAAEVQSYGADGTVQKWVDPYGNTSRCDEGGADGCHIGMVYGPGGGVVCSGNKCDSTDVNGEHLAGAGYLLYPTTDKNGKVTGNDGFGCQAGPNACQTSSGLTNLGWLGTPDASWMAGIDPTYLRPGQNTGIDKQLDTLLKPYGVKPGDPLPPLNPAGVAQLQQEDQKNGTHYYQDYLDHLPPLSQGQQDLATLKLAGALSTAQLHSKQLEQQLPGLQAALDAQQQYNDGKITKAQLAPHLQVIAQALSMDQDYANARALTDGIGGVAYQQMTTANQQKLGAKPGLVGQTPGETLSQAQKQFFENGFTQYGLDANGKPVPMISEQQAQSNAAQINGLNAVARSAALNQQAADWNAQNDALTKAGGGTPDQVAHMTQWAKQIHDESTAVQTVQQNVTDLPKLPGGVTMSVADQRALDIKAAEQAGYTNLASRLKEWGGLQNRARTLADQMDKSGSAYQKQLAKNYYHPLANLADLNYNTLARDQGSRDPSSLLGNLPLPSSGHPDLFFAVRSAYYKPQLDADTNPVDSKFLDQGGLKGKAIRLTPADRRAEIAARGLTSAQQVLNSEIDTTDPLTKDQFDDLPGSAKDAINKYQKQNGDGQVYQIGTLYIGEDGNVDVMMTWRVQTPKGTEYVDETGEHYSDRQDFINNNKLLGEDTQISTPEDWGKGNSASGTYTGSGRHVSWWGHYGGYVRCVENHDYAAFARRVITAHGRRVADGDVEGLPALVDLTRHLEDAITHAIAGLRTAGYSWSDIALRLGITRQAVHQRWGKNANPPDLELDSGDIDMSEVPW